ncbi:MAG: MarR family winged helix-turn-helix transcriptional regulator [Actinomycetota bacterium]
MPTTRPARRVRDADYRRLLALRTGLRHFLRWSEEQAASSSLTPSQHQLLLAIRGHAGDAAPTIGDVAASLLLRHHSAVELVDRTQEAGLVRRSRDADDHRVVRLSLTPRGARTLEDLSERHLEELARLARSIGPLLAGLDERALEAATSTA